MVEPPRAGAGNRDDDHRPGGPDETDPAGFSTANRTAAALRYDPVDAATAPSVVAAGRGWLAERILEVARDHGITVREDADLVEILTAVEIGDEVPVEAFVAVAEILRYVYAANGTTPPEYPKS